MTQGSDLGLDMVLTEDVTCTCTRHHPDISFIDAATMQRVNVASLSGEFMRTCGKWWYR